MRIAEDLQQHRQRPDHLARARTSRGAHDELLPLHRPVHTISGNDPAAEGCHAAIGGPDRPNTVATGILRDKTEVHAGEAVLKSLGRRELRIAILERPNCPCAVRGAPGKDWRIALEPAIPNLQLLVMRATAK